jgi:hypothetical protein
MIENGSGGSQDNVVFYVDRAVENQLSAPGPAEFDAQRLS